MRKLLYGLVIVVMGYSANILVSPAGVEPATSWLKVSCSTNWAKGPKYQDIKSLLIN